MVRKNESPASTQVIAAERTLGKNEAREKVLLRARRKKDQKGTGGNRWNRFEKGKGEHEVHSTSCK